MATVVYQPRGVFDADALLAAVFVRVDEHGRVASSLPLNLDALRAVAPVFGVRDGAGVRDDAAVQAPCALQSDPVGFDTVISLDTMHRRIDVGRLAAAEWRRRLASHLAASHPCRALAVALSRCGSQVAPPSAVGELATAAGVSREHFARMLRAHGVRASFCAKRLVDVFVVLQVLVMHALGVSHRRAAFESRIPYRTFLRARQRLERTIPGSTANFRVLMVHVDVQVGR